MTAGIVLERVEHAIAVMRIDVDVGDALRALRASQQLDDDAAVVEDAEAGGVVARGMMQAGDRHEGAATLALHDRLRRTQGRAHHAGRRLVDATERRRVAAIQKAAAAGGALAHELHDKRGVWKARSSSSVATRGSSTRTRRSRPRASNSRTKAAWRSGPNGWPSAKP